MARPDSQDGVPESVPEEEACEFEIHFAHHFPGVTAILLELFPAVVLSRECRALVEMGTDTQEELVQFLSLSELQGFRWGSG